MPSEQELLQTILAEVQELRRQAAHVFPAAPLDENSGKKSDVIGRRNLHAAIYNHRIVLTTYPGQLGVTPIPIEWGNPNPRQRGPILVGRATPASLRMRNAIGAHGGSYSVYRALAIAIGELDPTHRPDFNNTLPPVDIGPYPAWGDPAKIVSLDPFVFMFFNYYLISCI